MDRTRVEILKEIVDWINDPDVHVPWISWHHGQAGRGKSAIAHIVALQYKNVCMWGGICSPAQLNYSVNTLLSLLPETIHFPRDIKTGSDATFLVAVANVCLEVTRSVVVPQPDRTVVGSRQNVF